MSLPPFQHCTTDDQCPEGYYCEGGICVPISGDDPGGGGGGDPVNPLPGLGNWLTKRYTSNVAVTDQMVALDFLYEVLLPAQRGYIRQSPTGRLGLMNKKPVPYAFGTTDVSINDDTLEVDNVKDWIGTDDTLLLIAPHTNKSEIHRVTAAVYSLDQNDVTISSTGGLFTTTDFSGSDGASTPATGSIEVTSASDTDCSITIDGITFNFTTTTADTTDSIASYIAGFIRAHPALYRKFEVSYTVGDSIVDLTARFGSLTISPAMVNDHDAPLADPVTAPTLTASGSGSDLLAGEYAVAYSCINAQGETLLSKYKIVTLTAGQNIVVSSISLPTGATSFKWYVSPEANSTKLRYYSEDTGAGFTISGGLPKLSASLPPDLNRTGVEVMRVKASFSDRGEERTALGRANVHKGSFSWLAGNRRKTVNRIDLKYREASEDYRAVELRLRDDASIAKIKETKNEEVNGQAINNYDQALRIATSILTEYQDADFYYKWKSVRDQQGDTLEQVALLLEEGDVVAITDDGSGVYNIPVWIEEIDIEIPTGSMPIPAFTGHKYSSRLYGDSPVYAVIPIVSEAAA